MQKRTDVEIIRKIELLRTKGYSLPEISKKLKIGKTTAFRYAKDIMVLPQYVELLKSKRGGSRKIKQIKERQALAQAKKRFANLSDREKLLFISALYWGEGSKSSFGLSNTDHNLIRVFVFGLRELLEVTEDRLGVSIRIYEDLDKEKCLDFWSQIVGVPKEKFLRVDVLKGKKNGKLTYGMCRVRVRKGGDLLKKLVSINKIVADSMPL